MSIAVFCLLKNLKSENANRGSEPCTSWDHWRCPEAESSILKITGTALCADRNVTFAESFHFTARSHALVLTPRHPFSEADKISLSKTGLLMTQVLFWTCRTDSKNPSCSRCPPYKPNATFPAQSIWIILSLSQWFPSLWELLGTQKGTHTHSNIHTHIYI